MCEENMEGIRAVYDHVKPSGSCAECDTNAYCKFVDQANVYVCECNAGFEGNGHVCKSNETEL